MRGSHSAGSRSGGNVRFVGPQAYGLKRSGQEAGGIVPDKGTDNTHVCGF